MWYIVLGSIAAASAVAAICVYAKSCRTLTEADKMIDAAISGNFVESNFSEDELSRLGSKLYRYLSKGETSLAQINEEKDRIKTLISDISHQTKTPIANIMLYTQLLEEKSDEETREMIGRIAEQSEKLSFLIASLVKLSRLENGIVQVHPAQSSVRDLTRETFREFEAKANAKGVRIFLEEESEDGEEKTAVFDRKWTQEALANIVDNAIKYTAKGGKVSITSKEYELFARIDVSDTGIGIAEVEQAQIFGRFYRSQDAADEKGAGIGLYLAREILTKEGGYIKVSSRPGEGSCFSIFLPRN